MMRLFCLGKHLRCTRSYRFHADHCLYQCQLTSELLACLERSLCFSFDDFGKLLLEESVGTAKPTLPRCPRRCRALPCLIPPKLALAEIWEAEQEVVRWEERRRGVTDSVLELVNSPNLNKNGAGFLSPPGFAALKIRPLKGGSGAFFVPGAQPGLTPAADGSSSSRFSSPAASGKQIPLFPRKPAVSSRNLPCVSLSRKRSCQTQRREKETQQNYQETTWSTKTSDWQDLTLRDTQFVSFSRSCALTFYLGFSRLRWILLDIDFFF